MTDAAPPDAPTPPDAPALGHRKRPGLLWGDAWIALVALVLVPAALATLLAGPADPDVPVEVDPDTFESTLVVAELVTLLLFVGLPLLWLATTRVGGLRGAWTYLAMTPPTRRTWPYHLGVASLGAVGLLALAVGYGLLLSVLGVDAGGDPAFDALAAAVSWPSLLLVALVAGVGEEVLFRGVLQKYVGVWGQAAVFASLHVNQGVVALPFVGAAALLFGYAVKRGAPLWSVMLAHTAYDLIVLGALKAGAGA